MARLGVYIQTDADALGPGDENFAPPHGENCFVVKKTRSGEESGRA